MTNAEMIAARQRTEARALRESELSGWRKPTGHTQSLVIVARGELTCPNCGETYGAATGNISTSEPFCWRCEGVNGIPTVEYLGLQEGEYLLL
jgi:hypothetical protein